MSTKDLAKENNKPAAASLKTFMSIFRPLHDWLHTRPKTSTPISNPILKTNSANGHIQRNHHHISTTASANNINHNNNRMHNHSNLNNVRMNNNNQNNINNNNNNNNNNIQNNNVHNNSNNNSYGGDSLTGSSGDMLSTAAPTPIHHHHQHHSTPQPRFTPIMNGHASAGGVASMIANMDELNGSTTGFGEAGGGASGADISGMGSTLNVNQHFSRNAQSRMSLPIMQHNRMRRQAYSQLQRRGQQVPRSLGYIYLQHKGETKQASLPNELTTIDTMRALFVCAFPHLLTMEYMCQPHVKIYIYNPSCNIFYELCDIEDVRHESVLRIHHSDPLVPLALSPQISSMVSMTGIPPPPMAHNPYSTLHRLPPRLPPQQQQQQQTMQSLASHQAGINSNAMLSQHHIMQSMVTPQPQSHQQLTGPSVSQISQIPPPKPRRMIPASYSMHRLNPPQ